MLILKQLFFSKKLCNNKIISNSIKIFFHLEYGREICFFVLVFVDLTEKAKTAKFAAIFLDCFGAHRLTSKSVYFHFATNNTKKKIISEFANVFFFKK